MWFIIFRTWENRLWLFWKADIMNYKLVKTAKTTNSHILLGYIYSAYTFLEPKLNFSHFKQSSIMNRMVLNALQSILKHVQSSGMSERSIFHTSNDHFCLPSTTTHCVATDDITASFEEINQSRYSFTLIFKTFIFPNNCDLNLKIKMLHKTKFSIYGWW